jgi:general secretion pathway protein H
MDRAAVKAGMPTSARGSDRSGCSPRRGSRGFTLLELLIVITLIAVASSVAVLALRDPAAGRLEQEATRLASLFEAARAQARSAGTEVRWVPGAADREPQAPDFSFAGLPEDTPLPVRWLAPGVQVDIADPRGVLLGPEPIIGAQRVVLRLEDKSLVIATDGLGPFSTVTDEAPAAAAGG